MSLENYYEKKVERDLRHRIAELEAEAKKYREDVVTLLREYTNFKEQHTALRDGVRGTLMLMASSNYKKRDIETKLRALVGKEDEDE